MKNGVMVGPVSGHVVQYDYEYGSRGVMGLGVFSGQTDEEGLADGTWKLTMKLGDGSTRMFYDKW